MDESERRSVLVTGSAGFIGFHLARRLLERGQRVVGLDNLSDYYDVDLKRQRHAILEAQNGFVPVIGALEAPGLLGDLFAEHRFEVVLHLAAQAGVRHSIDKPKSYVESNLLGTFELLEAARHHPPAHMLLASTSSVYGANRTMPFAESARADHPMSFYAATKKATEAMAHSYSHLYGLPCTMFRFFTVYGPWGRPDMALFKFTRAILNDEAIEIYNHGDMMRDFTHVDDLVDGVVGLIGAVPGTGAPVEGDSLSPVAPFRVVNIGNAAPVRLLDFVEAIEAATGRTARKVMLDVQPGDVLDTWADTTLIHRLTGYAPTRTVPGGVAEFVAWYRGHFGA